jgi:hypothetical protein
MIKHVGRHNQRKVIIVYRTVPDENHMALVVYTDSLPMMIHDEAMKCVESEVGQNAKELADALFRITMADGTNCLSVLHKGGWIKKVPTNQVIVIPTAKSTCRLDELNDLLLKIEAGGDAADKLANIDANRGIKGVLKEGREVGQPDLDIADPTADILASAVLNDTDLAQQRLDQASRMESEAKTLLAEAKRLKAEAEELNPTKIKKTTAQTPVKAKNVRATKKAAA